MIQYQGQGRPKHQAHQQLKRKALEPQERHCRILDKKVNILVEYDDYRSPVLKGEGATIYCEHILECYRNNVRCKYSGISPLFIDPFSQETPLGIGLPNPPEDAHLTAAPAQPKSFTV